VSLQANPFVNLEVQLLSLLCLGFVVFELGAVGWYESAKPSMFRHLLGHYSLAADLQHFYHVELLL
jgi:hypothetical protein